MDMELKRDALIKAARGKKRVDTLLKDAQVFSIFTGDIIYTSVAIYKGYIVGFGEYDAEEVIDLEGGYVIPGLIDAHIHIESTMMTPEEFARAVLPHGTTTVIADPHEIANVMGIEGIRYMLKASELVPLNIYFMLPSCVPSTPLETSGARLNADNLKAFLKERRVLGLAEVMDYRGVIKGDKAILRKLKLFKDRLIDGHAPDIRGINLNAYITAGVSTDHESTQLDEAKEKLDKGLFVMIREGTTEKNLDTLLPLVKKDTERRLAFVTDDRHPIDILKEGHLDHIVRKAVGNGLNFLTALRMATLNPAEHYGLKDLGAVAPNYRADLVVLPELKGLNPSMVFKDGKVVVKDGDCLWESKEPTLIGSSINIPWEKISLKLRLKGKHIRVIKVFPDQILTEMLKEEAEATEGLVVSNTDRDILKAIVFERHKGTGNIGIGFVKGFGLKRGAIASSVAHDSHNIVTVGARDEDCLVAAKAVASMKGGLTVVADGMVLASLPLPVAGLMSPKPLKDIAGEFKRLLEAARGIGSRLPDPFMTLSFISLPVIPEVRVTDRGIVDVREGRIVSLFFNPEDA